MVGSRQIRKRNPQHLLDRAAGIRADLPTGRRTRPAAMRLKPLGNERINVSRQLVEPSSPTGGSKGAELDQDRHATKHIA